MHVHRYVCTMCECTYKHLSTHLSFQSCLLSWLCCSLLIAHCSLLIAHCSLLIAHCSLLTAHCSLLTAHCSLLTAHCSMLNVHCSLVVARCLCPNSRCANDHCPRPTAIGFLLWLWSILICGDGFRCRREDGDGLCFYIKTVDGVEAIDHTFRASRQV